MLLRKMTIGKDGIYKIFSSSNYMFHQKALKYQRKYYLLKGGIYQNIKWISLKPGKIVRLAEFLQNPFSSEYKFPLHVVIPLHVTLKSKEILIENTKQYGYYPSYLIYCHRQEEKNQWKLVPISGYFAHHIENQKKKETYVSKLEITGHIDKSGSISYLTISNLKEVEDDIRRLFLLAYATSKIKKKVILKPEVFEEIVVTKKIDELTY